MKEHAKKALKHDINVLGKTVPTMIIIGLFLVGGGSAALLSSFGTVSGTADVEQSLELNGNEFVMEDFTAGESEIMLANFTNNADAPVTTDLTINVQKKDDEGNWQKVTDTEGIYLAISEDVNYWFKDMGDTSGTDDGDNFDGSVENWEDWMYENPAWVDWSISSASVGDDYQEIIEEGDSGTSDLPPSDLGDVQVSDLMNNGDMTIPDQTIDPEQTVYATVWMGTDPALKPGNYKVVVEATPN